MEKQNNFKIPLQKRTWYSQIILNPVLILGANISGSEWDLWSAFVSHKRNFAKSKNINEAKSIFQMRSNECMSSGNSLNKDWFDPLFDENFTFSKQWYLLSRTLGN